MRTQFGHWLLCFLFNFSVSAQDLGESYLAAWKAFYPSEALEAGMRPSVFQYEDLSQENIKQWIGFNENFLVLIAQPTANIDPKDGRLLRVQAQSEIDTWKNLARHTHSLNLYAKLILDAIPSVAKADYLLDNEKVDIICHRLIAIEKLASAAQINLKNVSKIDLESGLENLSDALTYLSQDKYENLGWDQISQLCPEMANAIKSIEALKTFALESLKDTSLPDTSILGKQEYDRRLKLYTDSELTSTELAQMALDEIESVRKLIAQVSTQYLIETYPTKNLPKTDLEIIGLAFADMEKDAPLNSADYLEFWQELADRAVDFIAANDIATLPKNQTLRIQTAPESAGPAARIGWVASAPPFDPNPMTTLNLPSIPDTLPQQEQVDFWASFNKPFNRMIVIHELFPGHYMQLKISRETPHPVRLLFPYGIYIEGWATFTEKVLLDAGWEAENKLTLLAHLRKRLENANRAYTSVQVHCNGWNQDQVLEFSTETSLLAPQFAKSLWGRIINSPLQLTSYYLGGAQFTQLLKTEKERLGDNFDLKYFMDTIMKAGPIPIDEFYDIFKNTSPN
ncbi:MULTISPECIES: DUF885 family protein [Maribacter]|uniref:DUF885 family protein n=1 Tax=Maribacter flavus TaxID=1658664 RepID=A0ABU7IK19_9FLAO|nr:MULTISPECIES: DUF885 family protein [Maribacter]MDC6406175.1 DUF885 family protein [Maribacter sp. PR66]MEE1973295.1 DUF885 family protein [Maribacter flavus]